MRINKRVREEVSMKNFDKFLAEALEPNFVRLPHWEIVIETLTKAKKMAENSCQCPEDGSWECTSCVFLEIADRNFGE